MTPGQSQSGKSYLWFLAMGLGLYCIVITKITGDIGFSGDDWWVLACPYWNSFPDALVLYARKFLRPMEGLYWISLFKLFGFNKVVFHLCSLLLHAGAAALMGVALDRAFPGRRVFVSISVLLAFFLPPVSCLTYVVFTDNSRLSMVLFWVSVIAFQRWAQKSSSWGGLVLPVSVYVSSFLTYESAGFLVFLVPLLAWPVHRRHSSRDTDWAFLAKICTGICVAFAIAMAVRFFFLYGGAVRTSFLFPPFELLWSYVALLPFYLLAPFTSMSADRWALVAGLLVALGSVGLFLLYRNDSPVDKVALKGWLEPRSQWYPIVLGGGILVLGMLPYQLAGYGIGTPSLYETLMVKCGLLPEGDLSWFNYTWASRIYSSASFGVAILLACGLSGWRRSSYKRIGKIMAVVIIGFMAVFHAGLSQDWREAAEIQNDLWRSLVSQVPAVKSGTNFVFLDLACSHKRAEVIRRENGLLELVQMLYGDQNLGAWTLYSRAYDRSTQVRRQAVVMPAGFLSYGQRQGEPAPHDSLLVVKRSGRELVLLQKVKAQDSLVPSAIEWKGIDHLTSNFGRIAEWPVAMSPATRLANTAWTSGLTATLQLTRLKSSLVSLRRSGYGVSNKPLHRRYFPTRSYLFGPPL